MKGVLVEYKYYLSQLNENEAKLYIFLYNQIFAFTDSFKVDVPVETIHKVIKAIMLDHPELFWFEGKWKAAYEGDAVRIIPKYKSIMNHTRIRAHIENTTENILKKCSDSAIRNIKLVYDWLINNVCYSHSENDQTIEGSFIDQKAVCKGIAKAFQLLMNRLDIPSFLIEGTLDGQIPHIWNVVFVNDCFYHVDVTMGYQNFRFLFHNPDRNKHYPCFMVSDKTITETHVIYPGQLPSCPTDFNLNQFLVEQLEIPAKLTQYGILKYLDKGSTCTVFKVFCNNGSQYALKVAESGGNETNYAHACAEHEKMKLLSGCNGVVKLADSAISETKKTVYLLFPYCKPLTIRRKEDDFDPVKSTLKLGIDVLNALIECHNHGIYHLDIQPKNIYFDETGRAILGDFGNSKFEHELKTLNRGIGTLAYMAPEVYHSGTYGQASEIYSLGLILYALLNQAMLPFMEDNNLHNAIKVRLNGRELPPPRNSNDKIWKCISRMCAFDLTKRVPTYTEALNSLQEILPSPAPLDIAT